MSLHWPEARFALRFEREARDDERDYPPGTLVMVMRPEQVDDPEFAREVRRIVSTRLCAREPGAGRGRAADEGAPERISEEERRFVRNYLGDDPDEDGGALEDLEDLDDLIAELLCEAGPDGVRDAPVVEVYVERCDQLVVSG